MFCYITARDQKGGEVALSHWSATSGKPALVVRERSDLIAFFPIQNKEMISKGLSIMRQQAHIKPSTIEVHLMIEHDDPLKVEEFRSLMELTGLQQLSLTELRALELDSKATLRKMFEEL